MTRKDYIAVAEALRKVRPQPTGEVSVGHNAALEQFELDVRAIAVAMVNDNPNFNGTKFLEACGV